MHFQYCMLAAATLLVTYSTQVKSHSNIMCFKALAWALFLRPIQHSVHSAALHTVLYSLCRDGIYIANAVVKISLSHWQGPNSGQLLPLTLDFALHLTFLIGLRL